MSLVPSLATPREDCLATRRRNPQQELKLLVRKTTRRATPSGSVEVEAEDSLVMWETWASLVLEVAVALKRNSNSNNNPLQQSNPPQVGVVGCLVRWEMVESLKVEVTSSAS